jgi:hypothetical protein
LYALVWKPREINLQEDKSALLPGLMSDRLGFLRKKRRGDGWDVIVFVIIVIVVLAIFGYISI